MWITANSEADLRIIHCRLCASDKVEKIVDLGHHPLADTFLSEDLQFGPEAWYPLQLGLCRACGHVFTLFAVSPEERYQKQDYSYDSSNSNVSIAHFRGFAEAVLRAGEVHAKGLVVDIGSNVGTLLSHFNSLGYSNILGVEPSRNISELAVAAGIPTIVDFFGLGAVARLKEQGPVSILLSANVLNHADDLNGLLQCARSVLASDGLFVFEVPYLLKLVSGTAFDTIYHEHVHYHAIRPLDACLRRNGFSVFKVEQIDYMCGSIRVYARLGNGRMPAEVSAMIAAEERFGLYEPATYQAFMGRVRAMKLNLIEQLAQIRKQGGKIVGIGAATKGNTLLNYCRFDSDLIPYIADASPLKIGKRTPGSHIPIVADNDIDPSATHALILPWNIAPMLREKLGHLGLAFCVPQVEPYVDTL